MVHIIRRRRIPNFSSRRIQTQTQHALKVLGREDEELTVVLTDDAELRWLNRSYRAVDAPTDVLAFSQGGMPSAPEEPLLLGDVVISVERASVQAEEEGCPLQEEVLRLAVHGILHLAGYDHQTVEEEKVMRTMEDALLREIEGV